MHRRQGLHVRKPCQTHITAWGVGGKKLKSASFIPLQSCQTPKNGWGVGRLKRYYNDQHNDVHLL